MTVSVSLLQSPPDFAPVYNEMVYIIDSTNKANINFKYVFDVYDSAGTTLLARVKRFPEPVNGYGFYDVHRILESFVTFNLSNLQLSPTNAGTACLLCDSVYKAYKIKFGEEYIDSGDSSIVFNEAVLSTNVMYAYNAVFDYPDFGNYSQDDWLITSGNGRFLSNAPSTQSIRLNTNAFLHFMYSTANLVDHVKITVNYNSGSSAAFNVSNIYKALTNDVDHFLRIPCGPFNINQNVALRAENEGNNIIDENVLSYTLQMADSSGSLLGNAITYILDTECSKYDIHRLHFLNKLGGFDSMDFKLVSTESVSIKRNNYSRVLGGLSGSEYQYLGQQRQNVQYCTTATRSMQVTSDWFSDSYATWLEELATSPEVYYEFSPEVMLPVNITDESYRIGKKQNTKLINLQLNFTFSYEKQRQRG
jgi:hypothetical protein